MVMTPTSCTKPVGRFEHISIAISRSGGWYTFTTPGTPMPLRTEWSDCMMIWSRRPADPCSSIDLDDRLVEEGLRVFKCKTKKELIHLALQELLKTEKRKEILKLRGRLQWEGDLEETRRSRV
jgi:Arc/MetJ family transcription regulator